MDDSGFRIALVVLLVGFVAHRAYYTLTVRHSADETVVRPNRGAANAIARGLALVALAASVIYVARPGWLFWASFGLADPARWLGVPVALAGFALLQWAHGSLARNWSDAPKVVAQQQLVTVGPYRLIRHPIYAAFLLILSAPLLLSANLLVGVPWLAMTAIDVAWRIRVEEALLADRFREQFQEYARRTGVLLPRLIRRD